MVPISHCELDSHADTCCLGTDTYILNVTGSADAGGFHEELGQLKNTNIVTGCLAYDDPTTMTSILLIFHQVLHFPKMKRHLINPFQVREAGHTINEVPLIHLPSSERSNNSHTIITKDNLCIPLQLKGIVSYFEVRKPTEEEIYKLINDAITMTNESPLWIPDDSYDNEDKIKLRKHIVKVKESVRQDRLIRVAEAMRHETELLKLEHSVNVNGRMINVLAIQHHRKRTVSPDQISRRWSNMLTTPMRL